MESGHFAHGDMCFGDSHARKLRARFSGSKVVEEKYADVLDGMYAGVN